MVKKVVSTLLTLCLLFLLESCKTNQRDPSSPAEVDMSNPASDYCVQQGNVLEIVTAPDGNQSGMCIFPDGSSCDEWAFFRGECGPAPLEILLVNQQKSLRPCQSVQQTIKGGGHIYIRSITFQSCSQKIGLQLKYPRVNRS